MDIKELQAEFEKLKKAAAEEFETAKKELNEDYFNEENKEKLQEIEKKAFNKFEEIINSSKKNMEEVESKVEGLTDSEKDEVKELGKKAQDEYEKEMAKIKEDFEKAKKAAEEKKNKAIAKAEDMKEDAKEGLKDAGEKVKEVAENAKEKVEEKSTPVIENVKEGLENAGEKIKETAENIKEKVEEKTEPLKEKAEDVKDDAEDKFTKVKKEVKAKANETKEKAEEKKEELKDEFQKVEKNVKTKGNGSIFSKILAVIIAIILIVLICTGVAYILSKKVSPQDTLKAAFLRTQGEYNTVTVTAGKMDESIKPKSIVEYFGRNGDAKLVSQVNLENTDKPVVALNANVKKDGKELINYRAEVKDNYIAFGYKTKNEEKVYKTESEQIKMITAFLTSLKNYNGDFKEIAKFAKENEKEAFDNVINSYSEFIEKSIVKDEDKIVFEDGMIKRVIGVRPDLDSYKKLAKNVQELLKKESILTKITETMNKITKESEADNNIKQDNLTNEDVAGMIDGLLEEIQKMEKAEKVSENNIIYVYVEPFTSKLSKLKIVSDFGDNKKAELIVKYSKSRVSENLDKEKAQELKQPQFALMEYLINDDMLKAYEEIAKEEGLTPELQQELQQRIQSSKQIKALYDVFKQGMNGSTKNTENKNEDKKEEVKEKVENKKEEIKEKAEDKKEEIKEKAEDKKEEIKEKVEDKKENE